LKLLGGLLICGTLGIFIIYIGYLISVKKKLWLIAGYNKGVYKGNKDKLARVFGLYFILIGIITVFLPFSLLYIGLFTGKIYLVLLLITAIPLGFYLMLSK
jgi:hypothetical protein